MYKKFSIFVGIAFLALIVIGSLTTEDISESPTIENTITEDSEEQIIPEVEELSNPIKKELFLVTRIIDGDTIEIETGERVRLICMDTPERGEPGYTEAAQYLQSLILNKEVKMVKDISEVGKYGRLVRYIYLDDLFVNEKMVLEGYAEVYPYHPDITLCPQIEEAEQEAKENEKGIWSKKPEQEIQSDCRANTYNCDDFTTHATAQKIFEACGGTSNDIHQLDRDKDGIACESLP